MTTSETRVRGDLQMLRADAANQLTDAEKRTPPNGTDVAWYKSRQLAFDQALEILDLHFAIDPPAPDTPSPLVKNLDGPEYDGLRSTCPNPNHGAFLAAGVPCSCAVLS